MKEPLTFIKQFIFSTFENSLVCILGLCNAIEHKISFFLFTFVKHNLLYRRIFFEHFQLK